MGAPKCYFTSEHRSVPINVSSPHLTFKLLFSSEKTGKKLEGAFKSALQRFPGLSRAQLTLGVHHRIRLLLSKISLQSTLSSQTRVPSAPPSGRALADESPPLKQCLNLHSVPPRLDLDTPVGPIIFHHNLLWLSNVGGCVN